MQSDWLYGFLRKKKILKGGGSIKGMNFILFYSGNNISCIQGSHNQISRVDKRVVFY